MTRPGQADLVRQLFERSVCCFSSPGPALFSTAAEPRENWLPETPVSMRTVCHILSCSGLHGRITAHKPASNRRQQKNCVAFAKTHSTEGWFFLRIIHWTASQSPHILQKTCWNLHGRKLHPENSQVWWSKNRGLGIHPVWACARDLQSCWQHQHPLVPRNSCCPLHSKPPERANSSAGWCAILRPLISVPESKEVQGAQGLASPVTRHEHYWACLG